MRNIDDILLFRGDLSPFLVHLTKTKGDEPAGVVLEKIIREHRILPGSSLVSDIRFGGFTQHMSDKDKRMYFGAACFTETPLDEIHCLLDVNYRQINLEPYGLVFLKDRLSTQDVSPVLYLNNETGNKSPVAKDLFGLIRNGDMTAKKILPLFAVFGNKIQSPGTAQPPQGRIDFRWEREWRQPFIKGGVDFTVEDVFVGLCPHEEVDHFETIFPGICFVDPRRPMKWYATKLIHARHRLDLKNSVV